MATNDFSNVVAYLRVLHTGALQQSLDRSLASISQLVTNQVKARYYEFNKPPTGLSLEILTRGKEVGPLSRRPERRGLSSESIMGRLGRNVVLTHMGKLHKRVQIDPAAAHPHGSLKYPSGVPLSLIAFWNENRIGSTMPRTILMNAYLQAINAGRGGFGTRSPNGHSITTNRQIGGMITITPPDRPVWKKVVETFKQIETEFYMDTAKGLQRIAIKYGGIPI